MKKILVGLVGLIAVVIIAGGAYFIFFNKSDTITVIASSGGTSDIIAEDSYLNYAWGYQYNGAVICADGSVYVFDRSYGYYNDDWNADWGDDGGNVNDFQKMNEFIQNNAMLASVRVSDSDLKKMSEYIPQINPDKRGKEEYTAIDAGLHEILIYDYAANSKISLEKTGDISSKNTSPCTDKLVKLITKYTDKAKKEYAQKQKREHSELVAKWEKSVHAQYDTQMPVYADLSDIGLGIWKHYKDERDKPCILRVTVNGKIDKMDESWRRDIDNFTHLDDTDLCDVYTVNNILFVEQGAKGTYAVNIAIISKDDIKDGKYDVYMFNLDGVKEKIQSYPKQQMTVAEFIEKVKNNEL